MYASIEHWADAKERDWAEAAADELATAIATHLDITLGEDMWGDALNAIRAASRH